MKMAGRPWLVLPVQGMLLFILALHLCIQDHLATAEHNAAPSASVAATKKASVAATKKASVATTKKASVATASKASVATTAKASVATTNSSSVATITDSSVATANKALVAATNSSSLMAVTSKASVAIPNKALVTATNSSSFMAATTKALVAAANRVSVATTNSASVAAAADRSSVATITNSSRATDSSVNGTEETPLSCQSFQCFGERCYQDEAHANSTVTCHNETSCELYCFSSTNYTARCSSTCSREMCRTNSSMSRQRCALDCCNSSLCLQLNASSYGDLPPTTVPPTTTTTTRATPQNGKVCATFSCHGDGCFKGKKTVTRCVVGHDFCEMKKTGWNYVAGCSRACKAAKPVCASGMKAACYQECCPATLRASCLKLDGKVHLGSAGQVTLAPFLKLMVFGVVLLLNYRASTSLWG